MIFDKENKIAFMVVPKNASMSLRNYLYNLNYKTFRLPQVNDIEQYHLKYDDCINAYPNLTKYTIYGVYRNPIKRFISTLLFFWNKDIEKLVFNTNIKNNNNSLVNCESYDDIVSNIFNWDINAKLEGAQNVLFDSQLAWLKPNVKIINHNNIVSEVANITKQSNIHNVPFQTLNKSYFMYKFDPPSNKLIEFVKAKYEADFKLEERISN